ASVNAMLASKLFVSPVPPSVAADSDSDPQKNAMGRVPADSQAGDTLGERRIFNIKPSDDEEEFEDEGGEETEEEELKDSEGELEESELPLDLIGTLVGELPEHSMATLNVDGENKLSWVGDDLLEGKATLMAIAPRHIVLKEGAELKVVRLWDERTASASGKGAKGARRPGRDRSTNTPVKPKPTAKADDKKTGKTARKDFSKGVRKTAPYDYEIDRGMLDEQLQDLSALGSQARVVPNYRNGKYEGFKLVGVRPGSLYRAIGVRSGDVIKSVNGKPIDSPNKALDLFEKLKGSSNISLDIERRGQPKQLSYTIK
ncbi:MAG: type II secretion system protein GspC, partial [Myxococcota bacterium]|nr:type II secretion system protein GspC [Myxococcota bacterium]